MTAILFALLVGFYLQKFYPGYSALIVSAVTVYVAVEFGAHNWDERRRNLTRFALVTFVVFLVVMAPTLLEMFLRRTSAPYEHIHDGALQTELAIQFVLAGQTPYGQDYTRTVLSQWPPFVGDPDYIPVLHHYFYLPLNFLLPMPFYFLTQSIFGWFDVRIISVLAFVLLWVLLPHLTERWEDKLALLIAFGLNPLFVPFVIEGRNDVVVLMWLVLALLALQRNRVGLSAVMFALACATKATAWLIAPFYFAHLWLQGSARLRGTIFFGAVFAMVMVPFALWDFPALFDDTLTLSATVNPIWGYGFSMILLMLGVVRERRAPIPLWPLQLISGLAVMILAWRYQARRISLRALVAASAVFSFTVFFFSRNFTDSYLGYALALTLLAFFLKDGQTNP